MIPTATYIPVNYPILLVPIGCQMTMPNMVMYSGGFMVYYKPQFSLFL